MNKKLSFNSDSVVLSLCKEIEYIKSRSKNISYSLRFCQNKLLSKRLRSELDKLNKTRINISNISEILFKRNCDELSFEFLFELTKRSRLIQQI